MYGGTVSRCVESVTYGPLPAVASTSMRPPLTGMRVTAQPRSASTSAKACTNRSSAPLVDSIDMSHSAMRAGSFSVGKAGWGIRGF
jgi:hypothetical protein